MVTQHSPLDAIIGAAISFPSLREELGSIPIEMLPIHSDLLTALLASAEPLTRSTFKIWAEQQTTIPAKIVGMMTVYNRCNMAKGTLTEKQALEQFHLLKPSLMGDYINAQLAKSDRLFMEEKATLPLDVALRNHQNRINALQPEALPNGDDPLAVKPTIHLDRCKMPRTVTAIMDYLATATSEPVGIKHLFAAISIIGTAAGKRLTFHNWGTDYFSNLGVVILGDSGTNKSGLFNTMRRLLDNVLSLNYPATATIEAFVEHYCDHLPPDKKRTGVETARLKREICERHNQRRVGEMVLIDEFRAFFLTLVPEGPQAMRNGALLCRLLDAQYVDMSTVTGGIRVLGPTAFTFVGFSQADLWNTEVRTVAQQSSGLAARIIPVNGSGFAIKGYEQQPGTIEECQNALRSLVPNVFPTDSNPFMDDSNHASMTFPWLAGGDVRVRFGQEQGVDELGKARDWFRKSRLAKYAQTSSRHEYKLIESKTLIQAAKVAAILRLAEAVENSEDLANGIDAAKYLELGFDLVGTAHLANLYHEVELTEHSARMDKIKNCIARKGTATARDIVRSMNIKTHEVHQYLDLMLHAGEIRRVSKGKTTGFAVSKSVECQTDSRR